MQVIPAIDLLGGEVVRLVEGKRDRATVYAKDAGEVARRFQAAGATRLHVVDLDGAFSGRRENARAVRAILDAGLEVQLGGGVRDLDTCRRLLDEGVAQVVVGTLAARDPEAFVRDAGALLARIIVAVDAKEGRVYVEGWDKPTALEAAALAGTVARAGCGGVLYTDITRDGTGVGPDVPRSAALARAIAPVPLIASGGIGALSHLHALARAGVPRVVVGRALYEGAFTLEEAFAAATQFRPDSEPALEPEPKEDR